MPARITKRDKQIWLGKVQINGRVKTKVCATERQAVQWEAQMRANPEWAYPKEESTILTALSWARSYLDAMKDRGIADSTYDEKLDAFATLFAEGSPVQHDTPVSTISVPVAYECLKNRRKASSGYAANKVRKNLSAAWRWGTKYLSLPKDNPFSEVEKFQEVRKPRNVPPVEDFWAVYKAAPSLADKLMLLAYLDTAARKNELFGLRWEDVNIKSGRIRLFTKKRFGGVRTPDWIPMSQRLRNMMQEHQRQAQGDLVFSWHDISGVPRPFTSRQHWLPRLCQRAGVKPFHIHAIRHLSASLMAAGAVPLTAIQAVLRHQSATTTNRYLHQLTGVQVSLDSVFRADDLPESQNDETPGGLSSEGLAVSPNGFPVKEES